MSPQSRSDDLAARAAEAGGGVQLSPEVEAYLRGNTIRTQIEEEEEELRRTQARARATLEEYERVMAEADAEAEAEEPAPAPTPSRRCGNRRRR